MTIAINLDAKVIQTLDLSPVHNVLKSLLQDRKITSQEQQLQFNIDYPRDPEDPRELSEIPEIRLWFVRLDAQYPWLPLVLDVKESGELYRYIAMLVPHQFHRSEGIQYNPEALEIFVMNKTFVIDTWLKEQGIPSQVKLKALAQILGYELEEGFFQLLG